MTQLSEDLSVLSEVSEGRVFVAADVRGAGLYLSEVDRVPPLSMDDPHAELKIVGEGFRTVALLDGHELDALDEEIGRIQQQIQEAR